MCRYPRIPNGAFNFFRIKENLYLLKLCHVKILCNKFIAHVCVGVYDSVLCILLWDGGGNISFCKINYAQNYLNI